MTKYKYSRKEMVRRLYDCEYMEKTEKEFYDDLLATKPVKEKKCEYCGITFERMKKNPFMKGKSGCNFGIDRKDSTKGYIKGNIALSCSTCNSIKCNFLTYDEMKEIAKKYVIPRITALEER